MRRGQPLIGPFFFKDEGENSVSINAERYIATALRSFWTNLGQRHGISRRGVAPAGRGNTATAQASLDWLEEHFPGRHISLNSAVPMAPHPPGLSPLDAMVWVFLKNRVCINKPANSQELKADINGRCVASPCNRSTE